MNFRCGKCGIEFADANAWCEHVTKCPWLSSPITETKKPQADIINEPPHYTKGGIETIDFIKAKLSPEQYKGHLIANIIKYVTRHEHKNGIEDLKKARWYLDRLIKEYEGK